MIPAEITRLLAEWANAGRTGQVTLHFKDGAILKADSTTSIRIASRDPREPASIAGGSRGSNDSRLQGRMGGQAQPR